jgi:hypothetical protein
LSDSGYAPDSTNSRIELASSWSDAFVDINAVMILGEVRNRSWNSNDDLERCQVRRPKLLSRGFFCRAPNVYGTIPSTVANSPAPLLRCTEYLIST